MFCFYLLIVFQKQFFNQIISPSLSLSLHTHTHNVIAGVCERDINRTEPMSWLGDSQYTGEEDRGRPVWQGEFRRPQEGERSVSQARPKGSLWLGAAEWPRGKSRGGHHTTGPQWGGAHPCKGLVMRGMTTHCRWESRETGGKLGWLLILPQA